MKTQILIIAILGLLAFNCNNENKKEISDPIVEGIDPYSNSEKLIYSGVWSLKNEESQIKLILHQSNNEVLGSISGKTFDEKGKILSSEGPNPISGKIINNSLVVNIFNEKGVRISTATITSNNDKLNFKFTGEKINYPNTFTVSKNRK